MIPVAETDVVRDEGIRADTSLEKLAKLKPAFVKDGTVTAGNASPLNDGASAVLVASEAGARRPAATPIARIAGRGTFAVDPDIFGIGPVEAANQRPQARRHRLGRRRRRRAQRGVRRAVAGLHRRVADRPRAVNVNGGAIAIGHPLGASGGRILGTLAYTLKANGWRYGVAAICIGVGQGLAIVLEAV